MTKIAINGFGRIGRAALRTILESHQDLELVAINDLTDIKTLAHLLKFDSVYGVYGKSVQATEDSLIVDGRQIKICKEIDPAELPWKKLKVDVVLECTGVFRDFDGAQKHLQAGAKQVIISAPSKDPERISSFVPGVNMENFDPKQNKIVDMASCTTNCLAPTVKVLDDNFGIVNGFMSTIHSYTSDQKILDLPHKDLRRARAAALNVVPTTTGAAKAIGNVMPQLKGKLGGMAFRVPIPTVSALDLVCELKKETTAEEVNAAFEKAAVSKEMKGILGIERAPLVSSDYKGNSLSAIIDADFTSALGNMVKVLGWYDNEWAYACRLADFASYVGRTA